MTPQVGIYYWVPSSGSWKLEAWKKANKDIHHAEIWRDHLLPRLRLGINLARYYRGIPRGRVLWNEGSGIVVLHGDDAPVSDHKEQICREFNLSIENTDWMVVDHEKMNPEHQKLVMDMVNHAH
jgi:hypothetical protein